VAGAFYHPPVANRRARTRAIAGSWRLPLVVLIGVLLAGALVTLYGGLNRRPAAPTTPVTQAVVVASVPCVEPDARDTVRVEVDGRDQQLPINACGNPTGFQLDVELVTGEDGEPAARLAGTGGQPGGDLVRRITAVLLVLAGLAGAAMVMQLAPGGPRVPSAASAASSGTAADAPPPIYPPPLPVETSSVGSTPIVWPTEDPAEITDPHLTRWPPP